MLLGFTLGARRMVNKACQPANFRGPLYQKPLVCFHRWVEPVKQQILQRHKQLCFSSLGYTILSTTMNQNISKPQGSNPAGEDFFLSQSLCQKKIICGLVDYLQLWIEETLHPPEDDVLLLAKYAWCSPPSDRVGKNIRKRTLVFKWQKRH